MNLMDGPIARVQDRGHQKRRRIDMASFHDLSVDAQKSASVMIMNGVPSLGSLTKGERIALKAGFVGGSEYERAKLRSTFDIITYQNMTALKAHALLLVSALVTPIKKLDPVPHLYMANRIHDFTLEFEKAKEYELGKRNGSSIALLKELEPVVLRYIKQYTEAEEQLDKHHYKQADDAIRVAFDMAIQKVNGV